jgi:uncharacterized membrane protein
MVPNVLKDHNTLVFRVKQSKKSPRLFVTFFISNCTVSCMSYTQGEKKRKEKRKEKRKKERKKRKKKKQEES